MSQTLQTLIKRQKFRIDEQRRAVAEADGVVQRIENEITALKRQVEEEKVVAAKDPSMLEAFATFLDSARKREGNLKKALAVAAAEAEKRRQELLELFAEQKRYEIAAEKLAAEAAAEAARQETATFDEIAASRFGREDR